MRIFWALGIFCLIIVWFLKAPTEPRQKSLSHKSRKVTSHKRDTDTSKSQISPSHIKSHENTIQISSNNIEEISTGDECFSHLVEGALPQLKTFAQKLISDSSSPVGLWMYDKSTPVKPASKPSASDSFLRGLAAANLMAGRENLKVDLNLALELVLKAHELDPKNAAPLVFAAFLKKQLNDELGALELLEKISLDDMKFKTYETEAIQHLYKHVNSPTDALNALSLRGEMSIVDPSQIKNFLIETKKQEVGYLMVQNILTPEKMYQADPEAGIIFHLVGKSLIRDVSSTDYQKLPTYQEWNDVRKNHPQFKAIDLEELQKNCSLEKIQPLVDHFQEISQ